MHEYILDSGKAFRLVDADGFLGYGLAHDIPAGTPFIRWQGSRLPLSLWHTICAFFEWSQKEHKAEAQVRLYTNEQTGEWKAWAFPQRAIGMTTEELANDPSWAENEAEIGPGFLLIGTVHHHCTTSAFQSGTDRAGEVMANGIHITVGKIGSGKYDLHARVVLNRNQVDKPDLSDWFEMPESWRTVPIEFHSQLVTHIISQPPPKDTPFPERWKTNLRTSYAVSCGPKDWRPNAEHSHGPYGHGPFPHGPLHHPSANGGPNVSGGAPSHGSHSDHNPRGVPHQATIDKVAIGLEDPDVVEQSFIGDVFDLANKYYVQDDRILELIVWALSSEGSKLFREVISDNEVDAAIEKHDDLWSGGYCG